MIKWCKVIDETTGQVQLGAGCTDEYYEEIGMIQRDVEQSEVDNQWYLANMCPHYTEAQKTQIRKDKFESDFLELDTNKNFRLTPKGYSNAQQSIDTVNNMVDKAGKLTAELAAMVLFYGTPDFSKAEECTEAWLVQHQYSADPMTKTQWNAFYVDFTTKYAQKRYQIGLQQN